MIAYGAGWSDRDRQQPVGDSGRHEPRRADAIADAVRHLDGARVDVEDLTVRRPTLDDVFLTLTGKHAEEPADDDDEPAR